MNDIYTSPVAAGDQRIPWRSRRGAFFLFARNFFRHPRMLGSIVPSSRFLINQLLKPVEWGRANVIVEYGPGVGGITAEVLKRMRRDATLLAIETNPEFASFLRSSIDDERLHVVEASAESVIDILGQYGFARANYVISGIPFSTMPASQRDRILRRTQAVLEPRGAFLVYQFSTRVLRDLKNIFPNVRRKFALLNILPAHLFFCSPQP
jgi:phospholipid N-methyltransferase